MATKKAQAAKPKQVEEKVNENISTENQTEEKSLTEIEVSVAQPDLNVAAFATVQIISA